MTSFESLVLVFSHHHHTNYNGFWTTLIIKWQLLKLPFSCSKHVTFSSSISQLLLFLVFLFFFFFPSLNFHTPKIPFTNNLTFDVWIQISHIFMTSRISTKSCCFVQFPPFGDWTTVWRTWAWSNCCFITFVAQACCLQYPNWAMRS